MVLVDGSTFARFMESNLPVVAGFSYGLLAVGAQVQSTIHGVFVPIQNYFFRHTFLLCSVVGSARFAVAPWLAAIDHRL